MSPAAPQLSTMELKMKRKEAIKVITKVLKNWEDCKLTNKTSNEVLTALEELGIITPPEIQISYHHEADLGVYANEWEK